MGERLKSGKESERRRDMNMKSFLTCKIQFSLEKSRVSNQVKNPRIKCTKPIRKKSKEIK